MSHVTKHGTNTIHSSIAIKLIFMQLFRNAQYFQELEAYSPRATGVLFHRLGQKV